MIDGVAINLYGYYRTTNDIYLWLEDSLVNISVYISYQNIFEVCLS